MSIKPFLLIGVFVATTPLARGDYLFTWQGASNLFSASFEITDAEAQPGQNYYPSTYPLSLTNSVSVSSPDGNIFHWGYSPSNGGQDLFGMVASGPPVDFSINLYGSPASPWDALSVNASPHYIEELGWLPGSSIPSALYGEAGQWDVTYIPEPSAALLAVGGVAWLIQRKRLLSVIGRL